jgi:hypothetical protein
MKAVFAFSDKISSKGLAKRTFWRVKPRGISSLYYLGLFFIAF